MKKALAPAAIDVRAELDLRPALFGNEDAAMFQAFRSSLLADLAPRSAYEKTLAENLVAIEWEIVRHRQLRDAVVNRAFRESAAKALAGKDPADHWTGRTGGLEWDLESKDGSERANAEAALDEVRWSRSEIAACAYNHAQRELEPHERKLAELEGRRRRLLDDYGRLQARSRQRAVEDAEIVEGS